MDKVKNKPKILKRRPLSSSLKLFFYFTLGFIIIPPITSAGPISSCTTISTPGTYVLIQNISNSATYPCIYITESNVVFDGSGYTIDGMDQSTAVGVIVEGSNNQRLTNVTIRNVSVTDWEQGVTFTYVDESIITNVVSSSNTQYGIVLHTSNDNILFNSSVSFTMWGGTGVIIGNSNNNTLTNITITSNGYFGIEIYSSNGTTILNNHVGSHDYGSDISTSENNVFSNNNITDNWAGLSFYTSGNNLLYNNYFNNQLNAYSENVTNYWNTIYNCTAGANIIGGPCFGGNFWAYPNGTGFSETCSDADSDGICDSNYTVDPINIDYLPLIFTLTIETFNTSLIPEWNMISIPLEQDNWSINSTLSSIEGNYTVVFAYINGTWQKSTSRRFPMTTMSLEYGYWINMSAYDTLELNGTVPSNTTIDVIPEWNLAGYPTLDTRNLTEVLSTINYTVVFTYMNGTWQKSTSRRFPMTNMTPGYGYWVNATDYGSYYVEN